MTKEYVLRLSQLHERFLLGSTMFGSVPQKEKKNRFHAFRLIVQPKIKFESVSVTVVHQCKTRQSKSMDLHETSVEIRLCQLIMVCFSLTG